MSVTFPLTVYYDASCPLCRAEMHAMKARDRAGVLLLADCSAPDFDAAQCGVEGITRERMMARIHARDASGRWLVGIDVFAAVYRAAGHPRIAWLYSHRSLKPLLDRAYPWIADHRQLLSRLGLARLFRVPAASVQAVCTVAPPRDGD